MELYLSAERGLGFQRNCEAGQSFLQTAVTRVFMTVKNPLENQDKLLK